MSAAERIVQQLNARRMRENEYRARCPVHQGKSDSSLSIKDAGDRVLIYCYSGCTLPDILAALGMKSAAELFNSVDTRPDPKAQARARAIRGLEIWAERHLNTVCKFLRDLEGAISFAAGVLKQYEDGVLKRDGKSEEIVWGLLANAYKLRSVYEWQFEVLNSKDLQAKLELWREIGR